MNDWHYIISAITRISSKNLTKATVLFFLTKINNLKGVYKILNTNAKFEMLQFDDD